MSLDPDNAILELLEDLNNATLGDDREDNIKHLLERYSGLCLSFYEVLNKRPPDSQILTAMCLQLSKVYNRTIGFKCFCLQLMPAIIDTYLTLISLGSRLNAINLETLLLLVYNSTITDSVSNETIIEEVRLPSFHNPSFFLHDPSSLMTPSSVIDSSMAKRQASNLAIVRVGPYPTIAAISGENRLLVISRLWRIFNCYLNVFDKCAIINACRVCLNLCVSGLNSKALVERSNSASDPETLLAPSTKPKNKASNEFITKRRYHLHPALLFEMLDTIYFALHSVPCPNAAAQAFEALTFRASYELYAELILVINAIKDELNTDESRQIQRRQTEAHLLESHHRHNTKTDKLIDKLKIDRFKSSLASPLKFVKKSSNLADALWDKHHLKEHENHIPASLEVNENETLKKDVTVQKRSLSTVRGPIEGTHRKFSSLSPDIRRRQLPPSSEDQRHLKLTPSKMKESSSALCFSDFLKPCAEYERIFDTRQPREKDPIPVFSPTLNDFVKKFDDVIVTNGLSTKPLYEPNTLKVINPDFNDLNGNRQDSESNLSHNFQLKTPPMTSKTGKQHFAKTKTDSASSSVKDTHF